MNSVVGESKKDLESTHELGFFVAPSMCKPSSIFSDVV